MCNFKWNLLILSLFTCQLEIVSIKTLPTARHASSFSVRGVVERQIYMYRIFSAIDNAAKSTMFFISLRWKYGTVLAMLFFCYFLLFWYRVWHDFSLIRNCCTRRGGLTPQAPLGSATACSFLLQLTITEQFVQIKLTEINVKMISYWCSKLYCNQGLT